MEAHVGNRALFMVHGDQCAHIKGQYFVERIQINMIFAAALSYIFSTCCCYYGGGGDFFTACLSRPLQFSCKLVNCN